MQMCTICAWPARTCATNHAAHAAAAAAAANHTMSTPPISSSRRASLTNAACQLVALPVASTAPPAADFTLNGRFFKRKSINSQGQFSMISAFAIEKFNPKEQSGHSMSNGINGTQRAACPCRAAGLSLQSERGLSIAGMYIQREIYQSPACIYKADSI